MSHALYQERFSAYLDGVLSPGEEAELKSHLDGCQECREDLEKLRQTVQMLQALPAVPLPADFSQNLHRRLAVEGKTWATVPVPARKPKGLPSRLSKSPWISLAAAAAVILMVWTAAQPPRLSGTQPDLASAPAAQQEAAPDSSYATMAAAESETADDAAVTEMEPEMIPAEKRVVENTRPAAVKTEEGSAGPVEDGVPQQPAAAETTSAVADTAPPAPEEPAVTPESGEQTLAAAAIQVPTTESPAPDSAPESTPASQEKAAVDDGSRAMISAATGPKVIRSAQIELTVAAGSEEEIADRLAASYTLKSPARETDGQIAFLVPIESWDKAMILLEELGSVSNLSFSDNDISEEYEMIFEHLTVLRQEAAVLEGMLAEDLEAAERQDLEIQLHQLSADAASLEAQLAYMDDKVANIEVRMIVVFEKIETGE